MTILSDKTIRERLKNGELVVNGNPDRAVHCAYEFVAGRIFPAGESATVVDWTRTASDTDEFLVPPGGLVWIRTRETVVIPTDVCGFWGQTNTLARAGLMLVNQSIVDPGYTGSLSCNFVNFGRHPIVITPQTRLAKLIFVQIDSEVGNPFNGDGVPGDYDRRLRDIALRAPSSFLRVADLKAEIESDRSSAIDSLKSGGEAQRATLIAQLDAHAANLRVELKNQREAEWKEFEKDAGNYVRRSLKIVTPMIIVAGLFWAFVPRLQSFIAGDDLNSRISAAVDREIAKRVTLPQGTLGQGSATATSTPNAGAGYGAPQDAGLLDGATP